MLAFSGTLPATVFAVRGVDPYLLAFGRAAVAALAALICLLAARLFRRADPPPLLPPREHWPSYAAVSASVVFGFPLFSSLAMDAGASSAHAAVVIGLLPATTAVCAVLRAGERPRPLFWAACAAGAVCITAFTLSQGGGRMTPADLLLLVALLLAAVGYTEGGRLARHTPGWRVISYALLLSTPVSVPLAVLLAITTGSRPTAAALAGFAYVSLISMLLGFFPWYAGLAKGGIARAGQTQLAQPLLTFVWSWLLLAEEITPVTFVAALAVLACVAVSQRTRNADAKAAPAPAPGTRE